jgi:hypothetical protein
LPRAAPPPPTPQGGGTTIYVNAEYGLDCLSGLSPYDDLCAPGVTVDGPVKTITRALQIISQNPAVGSGPPYTIRIAARWHERFAAPFIYGNPPPGAPNPSLYSGFTGGAPAEAFPLQVPPVTLLKADGPNSELDAAGNPVWAVVEGPPFSSLIDTIEFRAGFEDYFTSAGGLDGSEIRPYGIEVRGGARSVYLLADGNLPGVWPQIPDGSPPLQLAIPAEMSVRIGGVSFSGRQAGFGLDAHILDGAQGAFNVTNCSFATDTVVPVGQLPASGLQGHTGKAIVHVYADSSPPPTPPLVTVLRPTFADNVVTVSPPPPPISGPVPEVPWGLDIEAQVGTDALVTVSGLEIDGAATPASAEGILVGLEFASNTGNPTVSGQRLIPQLDLVASAIHGCAVFGAAVATGGAGTGTVTRVEISGTSFLGNGVRPGSLPNLPSASTHNHYPGTGLHLVERGALFIGSIANNAVTGNRTGIALSSRISSSPFPIPAPHPIDLRITNNLVSGQLLFPPGFVCPAGPPSTGPLCPFGAGVGIVVADDSGVGSAGTSPMLDDKVKVERNRVFSNQNHGVWVNLAIAGTVSPLLRNNRIWSNGTGGAGDGVRIEFMFAGAGVLGPVLVHETIWNHLNGFGVNNVGGSGVPCIWNSIVYGNNAPGLPAGAPKDLNGFIFPNPPTIPLGGPATVNHSDFCGFPWGGPCTPTAVEDPVLPHMCISAAPQFENPAPPPPALPNFQLICAGVPNPTPPPNCLTPCYAAGTPGGGSRCIDRGFTPTPPGSNPLFPSQDATGAPRVGLVALTAAADMGALEKQTCTP